MPIQPKQRVRWTLLGLALLLAAWASARANPAQELESRRVFTGDAWLDATFPANPPEPSRIEEQPLPGERLLPKAALHIQKAGDRAFRYLGFQTEPPPPPPYAGYLSHAYPPELRFAQAGPPFDRSKLILQTPPRPEPESEPKPETPGKDEQSASKEDSEPDTTVISSAGGDGEPLDLTPFGDEHNLVDPAEFLLLFEKHHGGEPLPADSAIAVPFEVPFQNQLTRPARSSATYQQRE